MTQKRTSRPKVQGDKQRSQRDTRSSKNKVEADIHYLANRNPQIRKKTQGIESLVQGLGKKLIGIETEIGKQLQQLKSIITKDPLNTNEAKIQQKIINLQQEFNQKINDIAKSFEKTGMPNIANTPKEAGILEKIWGWLPSFTNLFKDNQKTFEKIYNEEFDPFGRDPAFELKLKPIFDFLFYKYWRIATHGLENIPSKGRGLLVANHSGTLAYDGTMLRVAVSNEHPSGRDVRFLVEDFVYYLPFIGTTMYRVGGVRASRDNAERLLNTDHLVAVFPEGVKGIGKYYAQRYHLQRFGRGGFIKLAIRTKSPIIPVAVIGAEEIHPILYKSSLLAKPLGIPYVPVTPTLPILGPLGLIPLPSKWSIYFGEPIDFSQYGPATLKNELKIHKLSEMVRQKIQGMVTAGLKKRRSVWFG